MEKFYFICQKWLAVEKEDGFIERILPLADEYQKQEFLYVLSKQAYHSISEGHLWFSIFSRSPSNKLTRIGIGVIVEIFAFLPSILLIQLFRRIQPRRFHQQLSPLRQAIYKIKQQPIPSEKTIESTHQKKRSRLMFPWWCLFIAYGLSLIFATISIFLIIVRGIEFGDLKTQKWLTSLLNNDEQAAEFIDEDHVKLNDDEDYLHSIEVCISFICKTSNQLDTYIYTGKHQTYNSGRYVYEFRGRLNYLRNNLSQLHQLNWIDSQTRAIIIQFTLYNSNSQLFISINLLTEFLSTGGIKSQSRFEPISFQEIQSLIKLKIVYFRNVWSFINLGIISCSWTNIGIYIWRYRE
ncbi:unnamed protein product [Rotaria sp. Silwood1]|nr:unnamed protein product [Rotaria sp. Silwood1]CAF1608234.1 unnamed protein product [Rotaria sp. Silwood1]